jgi:predicted Zn finger-like uncharacterized protein
MTDPAIWISQEVIMLIQCENCRTIFNLDERLLKEGGSRVRCSRCGHLFMAYPPAHREKQVGKQVPVAPLPGEKEVADGPVLMGDESKPPVVLGKDEAFESDLESVYRDAFSEPGPYLKDEKMVALEEPGGQDKSRTREEKEDLTAMPSIDFLPMDNLDEDRDAHEKKSELSRQPPFQKKSSKRGLLTVLLAILLALLGAVAAAIYWKPELIHPYLSLLKTPEKKQPADAGVRLLEFESVAGSFVDSEKGGQLFVIRGMVHNQYPKPRSHILIKGSILDNRGKAVESRLGYAGNTFTEDELKTLPIEELLKAMQNRDGMARQNFNVPSGATIPFIIVFDNLPDNLSEFAVEAVSSFPGT